jgi:site-specific DNA recombinase
MTPSHTRRGCRRYRYYVCTRAQKRGWDQCPSKSIPAGQIETFVVEQIGAIGRDPALFDQVATRDHEKDKGRTSEVEFERSQDDARTALASFDSVWPTLRPQEQARVLDLVVKRVDYDGSKETVAITFHPTGIEALAGELTAQVKEKTA